MEGSSRKRARPTDEDDVDGDGAGVPLITTPSKRPRLANSTIENTNTTPKTPKTVHTVASAISGALAYGVGMVSKARGHGKSNAGTGRSRLSLASFGAHGDDELSKDELDKLYDVPDEDEAGSAEPEQENEDDDAEMEAEETLVGSPTPDTPSRPQKHVDDTEMRTPTGRKKRNPLSNLAIDGTDRLGAGLDTSLSRSSRVRHTPKKFLDDQVQPSSGGRARGSAAKGAKSVTKSAAKEAATAGRPGPSQTSTPTKAPRKRKGTLAEAEDEDESAEAAVVTPKKRGGASAKKSQEPRQPASSARATKKTKATAADTSSLTLAKNKAALEKEVDQPEEEEADDDDESEEDDEVCELCGLPDSEPPNEILFCDNCDLAVHQQCYNVPAIPEGDWLCKNCSQEDVVVAAKPDGQKSTATAAESTQDDDDSNEGTAAGAAGPSAPARPPRSLAPDIANFETHLRATQRILLGRCTGRRRLGRPRRHGQTPTQQQTQSAQVQDDAYEKAYDKAYQLVEQTVVAGEGNSMMVIGARGSGKTALVESVLEELASKQRAGGGAVEAAAASAPFHVVRLSGFIHTDDKLALREIWRQLGKEMAVEDEIVSKTNNYADTMASLLALLSHPTEIGDGEGGGGGGDGPENDSTAVTSTAVVFVIDEFDLFATHARQTLLYNLFDIAQARKAPIAVLGLTTRVDVVESLEKRVKSRFSHRYVYLSLPKSLPAYWELCRRGLVLEEEEDGGDEDTDGDGGPLEGRAAFRQWWNHMVDTLREDAGLRAQLECHYYSSKSVAAFWTACVLPLAQLSPAAPRLKMAAPITMATGAASAASTLTLAPPDSKLHLLASLSELELALLIAAARLDIVLSTDTVNFAMAYDEYVSLMGRQRVQQSTASSGLNALHSLHGLHGLHGNTSHATILGGSARVWGRGVAARAWERLASLGLLVPAGLGGGGGGTAAATVAVSSGGLEGRSMWRTEVVLEEIPAAVKLGAMMGRWCKEI